MDTAYKTLEHKPPGEHAQQLGDISYVWQRTDALAGVN